MAFPAAIRPTIYSTNIIESLNKKIKRKTKAKEQFPTEKSLDNFIFYKNSISLAMYRFKKKRRRHFRKLIKEIYFASGCCYGAHKIAKKLQYCGEKVSEKFIGNLMHELGLYSIIRKKYIWHPKQQKIEERENIINRDLSTKTINQKWATDITYIHTLRDS